MADDMNICPYIKEPNEDFGYRVIYSALGAWCLETALSENEDKRGVSKNGQSILLHNLSKKYIELCPMMKHFIYPSKNADIAVFIRNIYEQTGYLITDDHNYNVLNDSGEVVKFSDTDFLYLGLPLTGYIINGLGIHVPSGEYEVKLKDFLIRDELTPEEYLSVNYNECDFEEKDIDINEMEFFNPFYYGNVSSSWYKCIKCNMTMARKSLIGPYYKVIRKKDGTFLYCENNNMDEADCMTGAEFRRLYVALRKHYDNPMQMLICPIDKKYSYVRILGQLPNREYFYLLMNAWPRHNFLDRNNFIIRNNLIAQVADVLETIGFTARNGEFYG